MRATGRLGKQEVRFEKACILGLCVVAGIREQQLNACTKAQLKNQ